MISPMTIYDKLMLGDEVQVKALTSGMVFTIRPDKRYGLRIYTVLVGGKVQRGYRGLILSASTVLDWCQQLVEVSDVPQTQNV